MDHAVCCFDIACLNTSTVYLKAAVVRKGEVFAGGRGSDHHRAEGRCHYLSGHDVVRQQRLQLCLIRLVKKLIHFCVRDLAERIVRWNKYGELSGRAECSVRSRGAKQSRKCRKLIFFSNSFDEVKFVGH